MTRQETIDLMLDPGVIAIVRAKDSTSLESIGDALSTGGVRAMEATMTTPGALDSVRDLSEELRGRMAVGVGSVLNAADARRAIDAGASFVVTPVMRLDVVQLCIELRVPVVCGAYTPTEAFTAHEAGADFIKLFPADILGPAYIKAILAPLPMLKIIPTGGVTPETAGSFLQAGCVALGAGSSLVSNEILRKGDMTELTLRAKAFVRALKAARSR